MNKIGKKYLPIGSVVLLKGATKAIMITGYCVKDLENESEVYDYCACLYPEGVISSNETGLFNHSDIEKVLHMGYMDRDSLMFKDYIKKVINENR